MPALVWTWYRRRVSAAWEGVEGVAFAEQWQLRLQRWREVRQKLLFPQLARLMDHGQPATACDLGCGEGSTTSLLLSVVSEDCEVTGIDVNRTLLQVSRSRFGSRIRTITMDLRRPRRLDEKFDLVLCCNVLMLLDDDAVDATLRWIRDHLAVDGVAVVSIVHPSWTLAANVDQMPSEAPERAIFPIGWDQVDAHLYYRSLSWYSRRFSSSGFKLDLEFVVRLPPEDLDFGARFEGMGGSPMFWLARLRKGPAGVGLSEYEGQES